MRLNEKKKTNILLLQAKKPNKSSERHHYGCRDIKLLIPAKVLI